MGGGGSKPAPEPKVIEQPPPAGSKETSIVYNFTSQPRLDGISRSLADQCPGTCTLQIATGVTGSSVKIMRKYGTASFKQCSSYKNALEMTKNKQMSWIDFINNIQAGNYMRDLGNGYCEEITITPEGAERVKKGDEFKEGEYIKTARIRKQGF